jgi:hypothetical protein
MLSKLTILENHPLVNDPEKEMDRIQAEEEANIDKARVSLEDIQVEGVGPNGESIPPAPMPMRPGNGQPAQPMQKKNGKQVPA